MRQRLKFICLASAGLLGLPGPNAFALTYEELCQYEHKDFCAKLRDATGQPVKPLPEVVAVLKTINPKIKEAAEAYGVDPRAIVGAILAENSLNVTKSKSEVKDFIYWANLQDLYKAKTGHMPSLGLGQIQPDVAMEVEEMVAQKEGRSPRSKAEVVEALRNPFESLKYAAAILRSGQDAYKAQGFDISKDPALLTTVYNVGGAPVRAQEAKAQGRQPRLNFFGFFVSENQGTIDEIMKFTPPPEDVVKPSRFLSGSGVALLPYPPECDPVAKASQRDYSRDKSYNKAEPIGSGTGFYKVVGHGVDCDMKPWSMIQTGNGKTGWVSDETLQTQTRHLPAGGLTCDKKAFDACVKEIRRSMPGLEEAGRHRSGALTLKINRKEKNQPANMRSWEIACLGGEMNANRPGKSGSRTRRIRGGSQEIQPGDVPKLKEQIEAKRAELVAKFGADVVDDKSSDLYDVLHTDKLLQCGSQFICSINKKQFEEFLQTDVSGAFRSYREAKELSVKYRRSLTYGQIATLPWKAAVEEIDEKCKGLLPDFPALQDKWNKYKVDNAKVINDPASETEVRQISTVIYACLRIESIRGNKGEEKVSVACKNETLQSAISEQSKADTSAIVNKWLSDKGDQEDFLNDVFWWLDQGSGTVGDDGEVMSCNYDPNALSKDVEKLAQNSCVDVVMVPDLAVVKKYTTQGAKKISYSQFEDPEVYGVRIKGACDE